MLTLPLWLSVLVVLGGCVLGYAYARLLQQRGVTLEERLRVRDLPLIPITLFVFVFLLVATNIVAGHPEWTWHIPLILEYYYLPLFWALKLAFVAFPLSAISFLAVMTTARYRYLVLAFSLFAIAAIELQLHLAHQPYLGEVNDKRTDDGIILQSNAATCAAASCANIARHFGVESTEADMIRILNTTWEGTSPAQMVYGLRALGLNARKVASPNRNLVDITPPAVLLIDFANAPDGHAVAYMGRDGDVFEMWDPQKGSSLQSAEEVREVWRGHAIKVWR